MCSSKIPDAKIFGSDADWETLLERSYNSELFSCKDEERAAEEEGKRLHLALPKRKYNTNKNHLPQGR